MGPTCIQVVADIAHIVAEQDLTSGQLVLASTLTALAFDITFKLAFQLRPVDMAHTMAVANSKLVTNNKQVAVTVVDARNMAAIRRQATTI